MTVPAPAALATSVNSRCSSRLAPTSPSVGAHWASASFNFGLRSELGIGKGYVPIVYPLGDGGGQGGRRSDVRARLGKRVDEVLAVRARRDPGIEDEGGPAA